jgi:hypothetical protein
LIGENIKVFVESVKKEGLHLKSKFGTWVDRVTIQEIRVDWREIIESFFLVILSIFLYASIFFTQFAFVPIMIVTIKRGWKESAIYLVLSTAVLLYAMINASRWLPLESSLLLFSPIHFTLDFIGTEAGLKAARFLDYLLVHGILGLCIGSLVRDNYKLKYVVFFGICAYVAMVFLLVSIASLLGGFETLVARYVQFVESKTNSYVSLYVAQMNSMGEILGIDYSATARRVEIAAEMFKRTILLEAAPKGGYLLKQIITVFLGLLFVKLYFKGQLHKLALHFDIRRFRIGDDWVWALIASWGLLYINLHVNNTFLSLLSWNSAVCVSFFFFLKGLKLLKITADHLRLPPFIGYAVLLFLLFYFFILFVTIVTGIGVADIWLKITDTITRKNERRNQ